MKILKVMKRIFKTQFLLQLLCYIYEKKLNYVH